MSIPRQADEGEVVPPLPCRYCGQQCYEIEVSNEGADWIKRATGKPVRYEEWVDTFRLWRGCEAMMGGEKDDHRTDWTHSMKEAIREWNGL